MHLTLKNDFKYLPCEFWLRRSDARVRRELLRVRDPSGASVCSRSVEKSESSVPSELLPAVLWKTTIKTINIIIYTVCHQQIKCVRFLPVENSAKIPCRVRNITVWSINSETNKQKKKTNSLVTSPRMYDNTIRRKSGTKNVSN